MAGARAASSSPTPGSAPAGVVWKSWHGRPDDAAGPAGVSPSTPLPIWIRLTPYADQSSWGPQGTHDSPIRVKVEVAVQSTDAADGMAVWRAIEHALYGRPGDPAGQSAALAALHAAGISAVDVLQPAFGIDPDAAESVDRQHSTGWLRLKVYVPTPGIS